MKSFELIKALEDGKELVKDHSMAFPEQYKYTTPGEHVEGLRMITHQSGVSFERLGWGSALGRVEQILMEIMNHPEYWQIK